MRGGGSGTAPAGEYKFFCGKGNENHELGIGFIVHKRNISAVKRVLLVSYSGSCYEELERIFVKFPKYHMEILLGDFSAKVGKEDTFKPTIKNESLHEISNDNRVRAVHFATSKILIVKSKMCPQCNIHKYAWTSPDG
jgi:hypothetical protein